MDINLISFFLIIFLLTNLNIPFLGIYIIIENFQIFNFFMSLGTNILLIIELFSFLALILILIFIPVSSSIFNLFSNVGKYPQLTKISSPFGETIREKIVKIYATNFKLSIFIIITIIFLIASILEIRDTKTPVNIYYAYVAATIICPGYLLSLRLLANPVKIEPNFPFPLNYILNLKILARPKEDIMTIRSIKEQFISFYYSTTLTVMFTLIFLYVYMTQVHRDDFIEFSTSFLYSLIPIPYLSQIFILFFIFFWVLLFTTIIGEIFLKKYEVIDIEYFS